MVEMACDESSRFDLPELRYLLPAFLHGLGASRVEATAGRGKEQGRGESGDPQQFFFLLDRGHRGDEQLGVGMEGVVIDILPQR